MLNNGSGKRYYYGPWVHSGRSAVSRYLGLKIQISGKTHYDWARVVVTGLVNAILTGYAYETIPGKAIVTGQTKDANGPRSLTTLAQGTRRF